MVPTSRKLDSSQAAACDPLPASMMMRVCVLSHSEVKSLSRVQLFVTPWTVAFQAPLSMGFSRQQTGMGCHFLLQGIFPTQGSNPCLLCLLHWQAGSLPGHHLGNPKCQSKGANSITLPPCRVRWAECSPCPQDIHTITPGTCEEFILHGKSDFAAVIKVTEFKTGRLS